MSSINKDIHFPSENINHERKVLMKIFFFVIIIIITLNLASERTFLTCINMMVQLHSK